MDASVGGQFWMEGRDEHVLLSCSNSFALDCREDFDLRSGLFNIWSTDESHGNASDARKLLLCIEAPQLPTVGVSASCDIHYIEVIPIKHDEARTGSEHRKPVENGLSERFE